MKHANQVLRTLRQEIERCDRPANRVNYQQFFKEKLNEPEGLKTAVLRQVSRNCFRQIRDESAADILALCGQLLDSGERYARFFAFDWASRLESRFQKSDFKRFESWLKKHVDNWAACDHLCTGPMGSLVAQFPDLVVKIRPWATSKNRWLRRASAVILIVPARHGLLLDEVFRTADVLLEDPDDMVQKGYGWMLKEATKKFPDEVFDYVMRHKGRMPRTALRYAIEKLPANLRRKAMAK